ncbi:hypothetical protein EVAR_61544_1 [Eumeta japonica]|uniref:Uncharacterized protein n=1 Tax=Eumeta variegata TaxID=151549 RepID=A0A4C1ZCI1_EUMVA|nr:hypothetical protein EVAR_61544_1 [Eumeta japonica]
MYILAFARGSHDRDRPPVLHSVPGLALASDRNPAIDFDSGLLLDPGPALISDLDAALHSYFSPALICAAVRRGCRRARARRC